MLEHTGINCWLWSRVGVWDVPREPCNLWGCSSLLQWFKIIRLNVECSCFGHHVGWRTGGAEQFFYSTVPSTQTAPPTSSPTGISQLFQETSQAVTCDKRSGPCVPHLSSLSFSLKTPLLTSSSSSSHFLFISTHEVFTHGNYVEPSNEGEGP